MPFNPSLLTERLKNRDFDFLISKKDMTETIFNKDEIIFRLIKVQKSEIPDFTSFVIAAMGASGSDEWEMQNSSFMGTDETSMLEKISGFQIYWKLDLAIETYIEGNIQYIYEVDTDPSKKDNGSEISYIIETADSFIYFFTSHFYY
ncbi:hypothetical protein [Chryseobacterium vrystaatense]|uniref:Uncharacterized protein n=1 Tax=Chryseobacterium vrystaatense TaxID=307480 RepID=A0A1M5IEX9_9FLAO|nr:hypothetical protein [Chryseobacterium vrystaatense]SHG26898.1 hypothetical protein SAMN02787073_3848 [Chryseobacterium vrystaatense]